MTGDGPKVYNPKPSDQFFGKGTLNTEGPFVDVRRRVAPGLFTDIDRFPHLQLSRDVMFAAMEVSRQLLTTGRA